MKWERRPYLCVCHRSFSRSELSIGTSHVFIGSTVEVTLKNPLLL